MGSVERLVDDGGGRVGTRRREPAHAQDLMLVHRTPASGRIAMGHDVAAAACTLAMAAEALSSPLTSARTSRV